jgi:hypothetical protein
LAGRCEATGIEWDFDTPGGHKRPFVPTLDRIDSSLGYTFDNVRVVAWIYNCSKSDWTDAAVLKMARGLVKTFATGETP